MRVAIALMFAFPFTADAQVRDSMTVPRDLVDAIRAFRFGSSSRLIVGTAPEGPARALIPPNATVLGSEGTTVYFVHPASSADAVRAVSDRARTSGWRLVDPERPERRGGGFVMPMVRAGREVSFCGDSLVLWMNSRERPAGGTFISLRSEPENPFSGCVIRPAPSSAMEVSRISSERETEEQLELPTLVLPRNTSSNSSGMGSASGRFREQSSSYRIDMSQAELMAHLSKQLVGQGWTISAPVTTDSLSAVTGSKTDGRGQLMVFLFNVSQGDRHDLTLRVTRRGGRQ